MGPTRATFDAYREIKAVNWSTLKEMRRSPRHYRHILAEPREDTASLKLGRATHTAIFEPDRLPLDYVVWRGGRRAGKEWAAFCESHPDQTIINEDEYARCLAMRDAVQSHPVAAELLREGRAEQTVTWTDPATLLQCKARMDWIGALALCDLKTTRALDPPWFATTAARLGYHCQAAFYRAGLRENGIDLPFKILAVEAAPPFDVAVFSLDEDTLYVGDLEVAKLLRRVVECQATEMWPGAAPAEVPLVLPQWVFADGWAADDDDAGLDLTVNGQALSVG